MSWMIIIPSIHPPSSFLQILLTSFILHNSFYFLIHFLSVIIHLQDGQIRISLTLHIKQQFRIRLQLVIDFEYFAGGNACANFKTWLWDPFLFCFGVLFLFIRLYNNIRSRSHRLTRIILFDNFILNFADNTLMIYIFGSMLFLPRHLHIFHCGFGSITTKLQFYIFHLLPHSKNWMLW